MAQITLDLEGGGPALRRFFFSCIAVLVRDIVGQQLE